MIVIINYGLGNMGSIFNMLKKFGADVRVSSNKNDIIEADKLILPGVGAFDMGMKNLQQLDLIGILNNQVLVNKVPILGICLGLQIFSKNSEEGNLPGLGWIDAKTIKFHFPAQNNQLKVPHMGWNTINIKVNRDIFNNMPEEPRFYFVHSYHIVGCPENEILTTTFYGYEFISSIQKGNITGTQFHPEKSHLYGMALLKNFVEL